MTKVGGKSHLVDIDVALKHETEKAWLVYNDNPNDAVWIPKSQGEMEQVEIEDKNLWVLTIPDWLAYEEGLM